MIRIVFILALIVDVFNGDELKQQTVRLEDNDAENCHDYDIDISKCHAPDKKKKISYRFVCDNEDRLVVFKYNDRKCKSVDKRFKVDKRNTYQLGKRSDFNCDGAPIYVEFIATLVGFNILNESSLYNVGVTMLVIGFSLLILFLCWIYTEIQEILQMMYHGCKNYYKHNIRYQQLNTKDHND